MKHVINITEASSEKKKTYQETPMFLKLMYSFMDDEMDVTYLPAGQLKLLLKLSYLSESETNRINLNAIIRREIIKSLNIAMPTFKTNLSHLSKSVFLLKIETNRYMLNPNFISKSGTERTKDLIRVWDLEVEQKEMGKL